MSRRISIVALGAVLFAVLVRARLRRPPSAEAADPAARSIPLTLPPGTSTRLELRGVPLTLEVPADEGMSIGSLVLHAADRDPLVMERDGAPTAAWVVDLDADDEEELLLVFRSAGSGSYATLVEVDDRDGAWTTRTLPSLGAGFPGYQGHGEVIVRRSPSAAVVDLRYPVYGRHLEVDPHPVDALLDGHLPLSVENDTNSAPTDGHRRARFDRATGTWVPAR